MPQEAPPSPQDAKGGHGLAVFGLVLAIISIVLALSSLVVPFLGLITGPLALIGGVVGLVLAVMANKRKAPGESIGGLTTAAIIVAIFALVIGAAGTACQYMCAAGIHEAKVQADQAANNAGFAGGIGEAFKAAAEMPKRLDDAAKKAGYKDFADWMQKDPKAATAAQQKISDEYSKKIQKTFGAPQGGGTGGEPSGGGGN